MGLIGKKSIGLDVSDHTIELVELKKVGAKAELLNYSRVFLAAGVIKNGRIMDKKKLKAYFNRLFTRSKPGEIDSNKVNFALPEKQVFNHFFSLDYNREEEIESLVYQEAVSSIPLEKESLWLNYKILRKERGEEKQKRAWIFLAATDKEICRQWQDFFREGNLEIDSFELPCLASSRVIRGVNKGKVALVDIGSGQTSLSVLRDNSLVYSCSINIAGNKFTDTIAKAGDISRKEAEKIKKSGGLNMKNKKPRRALEDKVRKLIREISEVLEYTKEEFGISAEKIILVGGSGQMKGLVSLLEQETGARAETGRPSLDNKNVSWKYLGAVGLAWGDLNSEYDQDLRIPLVGKKNNFDIDDLLEQEEGSREDKKDLKKKILIFTAVILVGILGVFGAYIFRQQEKESARQGPSGAIEKYKTVRSLDLEIPLAVDPEVYAEDRVRARTVEISVSESGDRDKDRQEAKKKVNYKVSSGEVLWPQPLKVTSPWSGEAATTSRATTSTSSRSGQLVFEWLIYSEDGLSQVLTQKIKDKDFSDKFIFNSVEKKKVQATNDPDIYNILVQARISTP